MAGLLFVLIIACAAILGVIALAWTVSRRFLELWQRLDALQGRVDALTAPGASKGSESTSHARPSFTDEPSAKAAAPSPATVTADGHAPGHSTLGIEMDMPQLHPIAAMAPSYTAPASNKDAQAPSFEQQFGGRLFVWLGSLALALAGFFMVRYSIESGLLTPSVRVLLGTAFGIVLLAGSYVIAQFTRMADGTRIAQALAGAGVADLYGCLFAATTLYHFLPSWLGFAGMATVTALTLVLALRFGPPIAVLGLIGGFVTPLLVHGDPNAPVLFGYLFLVVGGLTYLARRQNWIWLAGATYLTAYLWVVFWITSGLAASDGGTLSLFLIGVTALSFIMARDTKMGTYADLDACVTYLSVGGALSLLGIVTHASGYGAFEWDMFGLLSLGAIVLAWMDGRRYGFAAWLAMGVNAVMLLSWQSSSQNGLCVAIVSFGALFALSSYLAYPRAKRALPWTALCATSTMVYFLLAYHRLGDTVAAFAAPFHIRADSAFACLAFLFSLLFAAATYRLRLPARSQPDRQSAIAVFAVICSAFLSLGLALLLEQDYLIFALAAQVLTTALIDRRTEIPVLRIITMILTAIFAVLLLPEIATLVGSPLGGPPLMINRDQGSVYRTVSVVWDFGLPALFLAGSSWLMRAKKDDEFVVYLECISFGLLASFTYALVLNFFADSGIETGFIARGTVSTSFLVLCLLAVMIGERLDRPALSTAGLVLAGFAILRLVGLDLLLHNPLWTHQYVGSAFLFNALALGYALPAVLVWGVTRALSHDEHAELRSLGKAVAFALTFIFVSLQVRQFYHGTFLDGQGLGDAEVYSYSAIWLLLGVGFLFIGTWRQDSAMRIASLLILLLTVSKVFLYDASELAGLWRVLSFLGLGLSLLGLSWFYSRYVFRQNR